MGSDKKRSNLYTEGKLLKTCCSLYLFLYFASSFMNLHLEAKSINFEEEKFKLILLISEIELRWRVEDEILERGWTTHLTSWSIKRASLVQYQSMASPMGRKALCKLFFLKLRLVRCFRQPAEGLIEHKTKKVVKPETKQKRYKKERFGVKSPTLQSQTTAKRAFFSFFQFCCRVGSAHHFITINQNKRAAHKHLDPRKGNKQLSVDFLTLVSRAPSEKWKK